MKDYRVSKCQIDDQKAWNKFSNLIVWAAKHDSKYYTKTQFTYDDFYGFGVEIFALCLKKAKEKSMMMSEFGKYFKTSLFNRFRQIQNRAFLPKYKGIHISCDDVLTLKGVNGFAEVESNEMINYVKSLLFGLERKIFRLMTMPPQNLVEMVLKENSRMLKKELIKGTRPSQREVSITYNHIFKYINQRQFEHGLPSISKNRFEKRRRSMSKRVLTIINSDPGCCGDFVDESIYVIPRKRVSKTPPVIYHSLDKAKVYSCSDYTQEELKALAEGRYCLLKS